MIEPLIGYLMLAQRLFDGDQSVRRAWDFGPATSQCLTVSDIVSKAAMLWGQNASWKIEHDGNAPHESPILRIDSAQATTELECRSLLNADSTLDFTVAWYQRWAGGATPAALRDVMLDQIRTAQAKASKLTEV